MNCPTDICTRAFNFAKLYLNTETEYKWGAQDPVRSVAVDCSGLVIMCYKYAIVDTEFSLLFNDTTALNIYKYYSTKTTEPRQGDLIFMGETDSNEVTHIAIFDYVENGQVYFIDSTLKDTNSDGIYDINGVTERNYEATDKKIKSYGVMILEK